MSAKSSELCTCPRCGITRRVNTGRPTTPICRDCRYVLSNEEQEAWAA